MYCGDCGTNLPDGSSFCCNCGKKQGVPAVINNSFRHGQLLPPIERTRDEFTTIFLWVVLYLFGITGAALIVLTIPLKTMFFKLYGGLALTGAVCIFFILRWYKWALFCLFAVALAAGFITAFLYSNSGLNYWNGFTVGIFIVLLFMAVVFGILQIRNKSGKSTWSQMK